MLVPKVEAAAMCKLNPQDPILELDHKKCLEKFYELNYK